MGHQVNVEQVTLNNQIYIESPSSAVLNNSYYNSLLSRDANELVLPVRWLKCGDLTKGFNKQGNLVLIIDEFNNYIAIDYNADGSVSKVSNNNGNYVNFTYNDEGYLASLVNSRNQKVKYTYESYSNMLKTIEYCDLEVDNVTERIYKTVNLSYVLLKKNLNRYIGVSSIETSDNYKTEISYDSSLFCSQVDSIYNYSITARNEADELELTELSNFKFEFDYLNSKTTLTNEFGDQEIYEYENGKKLVNCYSIKNGKVADAKKMDYISYFSYTTTTAKPSILNKNPLNSFIFQPGKKLEIELNAFNLPISSTLSNYYITNDVYKKVQTLYEYDNNLNCTKKEITEIFYDADTSEASRRDLITINNIYNANTGKLAKQITHKSDNTGNANKKAEVVEYVYDDYGNQIKKINYAVDWDSHLTTQDCNCSASATTDKFYSEKSYNDEHNVISVKDETGLNNEEYSYFAHSKCLSRLINGDRTIFYGYDSRDRLLEVSSTINGNNNGNTINYNLDMVTEMEHSSGTKFTIDYDAKRRISCVKIDGNVLENYSYEDKLIVGEDVIDRVTKVDANNTSFKIESDRTGKFIKKYCDDELQLTENYNANGYLDNIIDSSSNRNKNFTYDDYGNIIKFEEGAGENLLTETFNYNSRGLIDNINYSGIVSRLECFTYSKDSDAVLTEIAFNNLNIKQSFDINGRLTSNKVVLGVSEISNETITYRKEGDHATSMPSKKVYKNLVTQTLTNTPRNPFLPDTVPTNESSAYYYDEYGNIERIVQDGYVISKYYYDKINRLIREDNYQFNETYKFEYDDNGNIEYKRTYKLNSDTELTNTAIYSYDKDKLISYNTEQFVYDKIGNPTTYRNKTVIWSNGKQLTYFDGNSFEYDGQGRRIKKNKISYYYDSKNRLIKQSNGLEFFYKGNEVVAVVYKNNWYYYRKDIQGNVIAILDGTGKKVVVYCYDAWGNQKISVLQNSSSEIIGLASLNPFRYRSYYYDTETGLYFLKSRYYDPKVGRWLNSDNPLIATIGKNYLNGLNLYAYCFNNPIMYIEILASSI